MTLQTGTRLGPYEVLAPLGAGGMGEVYRARDTRLKRDVALKVLPAAFSQDPERLARFQREAELLATLSHPNIAVVYGLEQTDGISAIVLELVEGDTMADLIAHGPIGLADALPIARQIADALEAAHEKGVVHRDLKPGNIKVGPEGRVRVLDFGLAKLLESDVVSSELTMSPTLSVQATRAGVILGTAAYMSPEQARGKRVDRRTDVWAFGCVLFEMLTAKQAFDPGETVSDAIVSVLTKEPDWDVLPEDTPGHIRTLLRRCLQKDPQKRLPHIGLARIEIDEADEIPSSAHGTGPDRTIQRRSRWTRALPWAMASASAIGLAAVIVLWGPWRATPLSPAMHMTVELGADVSLASDQGASAILSPNGTVLAFVVQQRSTPDSTQLYVRLLNQLVATPLSGTEGAASPFFSPDGQWIAFFAGGKLKKIAVTGGATVTLCDAEAGRGGWWAEDNTIVFQPVADPTSSVGLLRVSAAGGQPVPVTSPDAGERTPRWPQVLNGGRAVLYTVGTSQAAYDNANLVVQRLPDGEKKILYRGGYYGRYLPSGHLVYVREGALFAAPFDLERLDLTGPPVPVLQGLTSSTSSGGAQFALAETGTLVYLPGDEVRNFRISQLHWLDQSGTIVPFSGTRRIWGTPRFSPDGRRLAVTTRDAARPTTDIWTYDWERDTLTRLTLDDAQDIDPVWTPDGRRIVFTSNRSNRPFNLYWQQADGSGEVQRLTDSQQQQRAFSWHPTGRFLAFTEGGLNSPQAIMILPLQGDEATGWKPGKPTEFISGRGTLRVGEPMFSPDGRWLAYTSDESGRSEVYVQPFPGPGGRWQVSSGGGTEPIWSASRNELLFRTPDVEAQVMVASYSAEERTFVPQKARPWTKRRVSGSTAWTPSERGGAMDLHPDGRRLVVAPIPEVQTQPAAPQDKVVFILNFFDELRRLAPVQ